MKDFRQDPQKRGPRPAAPRNLESAVEALNNLIYVALQEADRPEQVRVYLKHAQNHVASICEALKQGAVWKPPLN